MNKQRKVIELIIYLVLLIVGIVLLLNGFNNKNIEIFPNPSLLPQATDAWIVPEAYQTYDDEFTGI